MHLNLCQLHACDMSRGFSTAPAFSHRHHQYDWTVVAASNSGPNHAITEIFNYRFRKHKVIQSPKTKKGSIESTLKPRYGGSSYFHMFIPQVNIELKYGFTACYVYLPTNVAFSRIAHVGPERVTCFRIRVEMSERVYKSIL